MIKKCKEFFGTLSETFTVTKADGLLIVAIATLFGVIIGMLCSPRKHTVWYNGNTVTKNCTGDDWDDIFEDEFDEAEECLSFK